MARPREHDRDQIAKDMLIWARKDDSLNLNGFCGWYEPPIAPSKITIWAKEDDWFRKAYECVKAILAIKREQKLSDGTLHAKAYDLNARVYDHFLKEEWKESLSYEAQLKLKEVETVTEEQKSHVASLFSMFNDQSARNIEDKSKIKDAKS